MLFDNDVLRTILGRVKSQAGCRLDQLADVLPEFRYTDYDPRYLVLESVRMLVEWGLVEAWDKGRILSAREFASFNRWEWPQGVTLHVSKSCVEIESAFDVCLDANPSRVFGVRHSCRENWPDVFVLMPFLQELRPVYENHIKKIICQCHLTVARADDFFTNESIMSDIWLAINAAKVILADCTGRNPNVFYEIGIAHSLGKATILIAQNENDVPFDLRHLRIIGYHPTLEGMPSFEYALKKRILAIRKGPSFAEGAEQRHDDTGRPERPH